MRDCVMYDLISTLYDASESVSIADIGGRCLSRQLRGYVDDHLIIRPASLMAEDVNYHVDKHGYGLTTAFEPGMKIVELRADGELELPLHYTPVSIDSIYYPGVADCLARSDQFYVAAHIYEPWYGSWNYYNNNGSYEVKRDGTGYTVTSKTPESNPYSHRLLNTALAHDGNQVVSVSGVLFAATRLTKFSTSDQSWYVLIRFTRTKLLRFETAIDLFSTEALKNKQFLVPIDTYWPVT